MGFTFKRNKPTGQYRSFFPVQTDVKIKGRIVGSINEGRGFGEWSAMLMVFDPTKNAGWRWVKLKVRCKTEEEMRAWLNERFDVILDKFELASR